MSSGLLPHNAQGSTSGTLGSFFSALNVGSLVVNGTAVIQTLVVSTTALITGILSAAAGILTNTIANYTAGSTVTVSTSSANANILLSPHGTGAVQVKAGSALKTDNIAPTTVGGSVTVNGVGIILDPGGGAVTVGSLATLNVAAISAPTAGLTISTLANSNLALSPNGTGIVTAAAIGAPSAGITISTLANSDISLSPNGTGKVVVAGARTISAAGQLQIETTASNGSIGFVPNGTGHVVVQAGHQLDVDTISPSTSGPLALISLSNGDITATPNGTGRFVVPSGHGGFNLGGGTNSNTIFDYATTSTTWSSGGLTSGASGVYTEVNGKAVTITIAAINFTIGGTTPDNIILAGTAIPAAFRPTTLVSFNLRTFDNGGAGTFVGHCTVDTNGICRIYRDAAQANWTAAASGGVPTDCGGAYYII